MKFTDKLEKLPKSTYKLTVTLPWSEIEKTKADTLVKMQKDTQVKGFRKGKAPLNLVKEAIGEQKILEEASKIFLSEAYKAAITKNKLRPFTEPKLTITKAPVGGDWEIRFELAESPKLTKLADYKKLAKEVKGELKKEDIWLPGKGDKKTDTEQDRAKKKSMMLQKIFDKTLTNSEIEISPMILDIEIGRKLTSLYEEIKKLGLSIDQYLQSKKLTKESLNQNLKKETIDLYKSEFILDKIAENEKITVDEKELDKVLESAKTEKEKETLKQNSYFYLRLLRKQKTLDYLASL